MCTATALLKSRTGLFFLMIVVKLELNEDWLSSICVILTSKTSFREKCLWKLKEPDFNESEIFSGQKFSIERFFKKKILLVDYIKIKINKGCFWCMRHVKTPFCSLWQFLLFSLRRRGKGGGCFISFLSAREENNYSKTRSAFKRERCFIRICPAGEKLTAFEKNKWSHFAQTVVYLLQRGQDFSTWPAALRTIHTGWSYVIGGRF